MRWRIYDLWSRAAASYTATLTSFLVGTDSVVQVIDDFAAVQVQNGIRAVCKD
jgi:hypothetical protein